LTIFTRVTCKNNMQNAEEHVKMKRRDWVGVISNLWGWRVFLCYLWCMKWCSCWQIITSSQLNSTTSTRVITTYIHASICCNKNMTQTRQNQLIVIMTANRVKRK
jgi:hypothetical protein